MEAEDQSKFTQLSDCLMLQILSYLDATSLYFLSQTCTYFENIIKDRKLWKYVDARSKPNTEEKIDYCVERIHGDTSHLLLKADSRKGHLLYFDFLPKILGCKNLVVLSLENQKFCGKKVSLQDFPTTLEEISLRKTHVRNGKSFFQHSFSSKRNLRVLILDECNWLDSSFIMSVSKFPSLEIISIVKCNKLHYNIVPYLSVARQGCKKLKVLDCRFSTVGNDFLRTFDENENVLALYFQSMRSYQQDYDKPLLRNTDKILNLSSDDMDLISQSIINNRSLYSYKFALGVDCNIEELPESLLYEDPYPPCTCKYQENRDNLEKGRNDPEETATLKSLMKVDDFINFWSSAPQKFLCKRHSNEVENLPREFKDFFVQNQLMFHAGQTDSDSGSDSDFDSDDCCMYGMGKAQQLILLRLNEVDAEGNLPEPEVIDLNADNRMEVEIIRIDPFGNSRRSSNNEIIHQISLPERSVADSTTYETTNKVTLSNSNAIICQSSSEACDSQNNIAQNTNPSGEDNLVSSGTSKQNTIEENISSVPSTSRSIDMSSMNDSSLKKDNNSGSNEVTIRRNYFVNDDLNESCNVSNTSVGNSLSIPSTSSKDSSTSKNVTFHRNYSISNILNVPSASQCSSSRSHCIPSTSKDTPISIISSTCVRDSSPSTSRQNSCSDLAISSSSKDLSSKCNTQEGTQDSGVGSDEGLKVVVTKDYTDCQKTASNINKSSKNDESKVNTTDNRKGNRNNENGESTSGAFENESLIWNQNSNDKKGKKRTLNMSSILCEPSTSQSKSHSPDSKKRKLESNIKFLDDDPSSKEENGAFEDPTLPDSQQIAELIPDEQDRLIDIVPDYQRFEDIGFGADNDDENPMREILLRLAPPVEEQKKKKLKLRRLSLRGYRKITDSALNHIRNLKIDLLDLTYTSVTKRGIEQFLSYNPNCRVMHKDFCVCKPRVPA